MRSLKQLLLCWGVGWLAGVLIHFAGDAAEHTNYNIITIPLEIPAITFASLFGIRPTTPAEIRAVDELEILGSSLFYGAVVFLALRLWLSSRRGTMKQ